MVLWGKNSFFPLCALSKKQGCVSHSTSEAEVVALNSIVRTMLIPSLDLWETILKKKVLPIVYEDNQATAKIIRSGKFEKLRHVDRTHGVQLSFITEQLRAGRYELKDCRTRAMGGNLWQMTQRSSSVESSGFFISTRMLARHSIGTPCESAWSSIQSRKDFSSSFLF